MAMNLGNKRILFYLALPACALSITIALFYPLYLYSLAEARERLQNAARAQAAMIDSLSQTMKKQEQQFSSNSHEERLLALISKFYHYTPGFGKTGISMVGFRKENQIHFLFGYSANRQVKPKPVPWESSLAEPMRKALEGKEGTLRALDYEGVKVLAAYTPVHSVGLGVVAKMDLSEVRDPILKWGALALVWVAATLFFGAFLFRHKVRPILQQLEASEDLNRTIVTSAREGIIRAGVEGRIATLNPSVEAMFGFSRGEMAGWKFDVIFPHIDWEEIFAEIQTGNEEKLERFLGPMVIDGLRQDGTTFPVEVSLRVTRGDAEPMVTAIVRDISERHSAEQKLQAGRRLLETVIDAIPNPIWMKDLEGRYLLVNRSMAERFGLQPEDFWHRTLKELKIFDDAMTDSFWQEDRQVMQTGEKFEMPEALSYLSDGREIWERITRVPLRDELGKVAGLVGWAEDLTTRKLAELKSHQTAEYTRVLQIVAIAANEAANMEEAMRACLKELCDVMGWPVGHVYLIRQGDPDILDPMGIWHPGGDDASYREFQQETGRTSFRRGEGMPGRILESGQPEWVSDLTVGKKPPLSRDLDSSGFRAYAGFPIMAGAQVVGVIEFFSDVPFAHNEELVGLLKPVGAQLGRVFERERSGVELRDSELRLSRILDIAQDAVISLDDQYRIVLFNRGAEQIFGYTAEESIGETIEALIPDPFREHHRQLMENFSASKTLSQVMNERGEITGLRKNGEEFPAEASISKLNIQGKRYFTVILRDISEHKKAEEALEANRRLLKTVFDTIPYPLSVKDSEGRYLMVNPNWAKMFGLTEEEAYQMRTSEIVGPSEEEKREIMEMDMRILSGRDKRVVAEMSRTVPDNEQRDFRIHKVGFDKAGEDLAGIVTLHVDITENIQREKALRAGEERFRSMIEGSLHGIAIIRRNKPVFINQSFAKIFGYESPEDVMALNKLESMLEAGEFARLTKKTNQAFRKGPGQATTFDAIGVGKDGTRLQLEGYFQVVDWFGEMLVQITVMDVSDRIQLENQLRHAQKMEAVGQLAGGVAHDFNNVLQIIQGYTELAQSKMESEHAGQQYLDRVLKAAEGASTLSRRLLALSRRDVISTRTLDADLVISDLMLMMQRLIGEDIELIVENRDEGVHSIEGDLAMLEQVLINLIVNARDAMPGGGKLTIGTGNFQVDEEFARLHGIEPGRDYICIRVEDSGTGISPEIQEHIFEPFFTTKESGKGTGLGLSMAYGIVQQHRGFIEVESEEGEGTAFLIYLPASQNEVLPAVREEIEEVKGGGETILVAEDEGEVLRLVVSMLEGQGYDVLTAVNGEEALEVYDRNPGQVDMAILDVVMPKMGGRDVFLALRSRNPDLPVLFSTGYTADTIDDDFINTNRAKLIHKPFRPKSLFKMVRETLEEAYQGTS